MENARGICQASGFEYPLSELVRQWDGLLVHPRHQEFRNPQDFIRAVPEKTLPYSMPESPDQFTLAGRALTSLDQYDVLTSLAGDALTSKQVNIG